MIKTRWIPLGSRLGGAEWEAALLRLPEAERRRVAAYRRWEVAQESVLGWGLLHDLAGAPIARDERGKPCAPPPLDVSLSHGGGWIAAAVSDEGRIGIDVEREREVSAGLEARSFAPAERAWLDAAPDAAERRARLFRLWTAKEAYTKALGLGLGIDFRSIALEPCGACLRLPGDEGRRFRLEVTRLEPDVWLTVCAERGGAAG